MQESVQPHMKADPKAPPIYIHGLEGGPQGTKGAFVTERFGGSGPDMPATRTGPHDDPPSCFEDCFALARDYVLARPASTLIGSSFGGAITLALLQRGVWQGPVVLLAPAGPLYGFHPSIPEGSHAIIIHDPSDEIVSYEGSELLTRGSPLRAELWPSDGGHRLHSIVSNGLFERAIKAQMERAQAPLTPFMIRL